MPQLDLDDRFSCERAYNEELGRAARMPSLNRWINFCRNVGDASFRYAIEQWILCVERRIDAARPKRLKLPHVLREALELPSQEVVLQANNSLWAPANNRFTRRLYTPKLEQPES